MLRVLISRIFFIMHIKQYIITAQPHIIPVLLIIPCFINSRRNTKSDGPQNTEKDPESVTLTVENVSSKKYSLTVAYLFISIRFTV